MRGLRIERLKLLVILARYTHLEGIPADVATWDVRLRGAVNLSASLRAKWKDALLFRDLATLRTDAKVFQSVDELEWKGPSKEFRALCESLGVPKLAEMP